MRAHRTAPPPPKWGKRDFKTNLIHWSVRKNQMRWGKRQEQMRWKKPEVFPQRAIILSPLDLELNWPGF